KVIGGAAEAKISISGTMRWGNWAALQPTRIKVTWAMAAARARRKERRSKPKSASNAAPLVAASSTGAHQRVSPAYISDAPPARAAKNTAAAIGARASSATRAR